MNISAANTVTFDGANAGASGILSAVGTTGKGKGGDINVTAASLAVTNGAQLNALTRNEGDAGNVKITAQDSVLIDGENPNSKNDPYAGASSIFTSVGIDDYGKQARGNGGNINITTGSLSMTNGGQLNAITRGVGNAGNININARDTVTIDGERRISSTRAASSIFTSVDGNEYSGYPNLGTAIGNGGTLAITTGSLSITRGAALSTLTKGQGNAGNVTITARNTITLDGENSNKGASGIFSSVDANLYTEQPRAVGNGGDVKITTGSLSIGRGAGVFATTAGQGNAGNVNINAHQVLFDGLSSNGGSSGIFSDVNATAVGNGRNINIRARKFTVSNGARLSASSDGDGVAGNIEIDADVVDISGSVPTSGLFVSTSGQGKGGDIAINSNSLTLKNSEVSARSQGTGNAGRVNIKVDKRISMTGSNITTAAEQSAGGAITITARDIRLFGHSDITTNVFSGAGGGGNITLTANSIIAFDDSDILAFANGGKGGNITFNTPAFFGQNYRPARVGTDPRTLDGNNHVDINASAVVSGVITLPDTSLIQNSLVELPQNPIDISRLIANSCIAPSSRQQQGTFTITGSGGLPSRPGDALMSLYTFGNVRSVSNASPSTNPTRRPWQKGDPIVEPQGVYRLPSGQLVLSRECSVMVL